MRERGFGFALVTVVALCAWSPAIFADNGLRLGALGTAQIDGTFTPGEWDGAARFDFAANLLDGTTAPATLFVMNDDENIYLATRVRMPMLPDSSVGWEFDPNAEIMSHEAGNDAVVLNWPVGLFDDFRTATSAAQDVDLGGTIDGQARVTNDGVFSYYEISHPLRSGDVNDISVAAGAALAFEQSLRLGCLPWPEPCADTDLTGQVFIYPLPPPPPPPPVDVTPPVLTVSATPTRLWPPNHRLVPITVTATATDNSGAVDVRLVSITSSDADAGTGPGDLSGDITGASLGTFDTTFSVRAERTGGSAARVYTAVYSATDAAGNLSTSSITVLVPTNRKPGAARPGTAN